MRITELRNQQISADKNDGPPETFRVVLTDQETGDVIWFTFNKGVRDILVRQLTGGIVLAGGEFPKVPFPRGNAKP